ncbi:MAG TPA: DUF4236 domain-containing protein [Streptosporangiaceae bacterium]
MGFYIRKAFRIGPIRLNLSKRGLGASAGVPGARIGVDASGRPYVHGGRGGLYYRGRGRAIGWGAFLLAALWDCCGHGCTDGREGMMGYLYQPKLKSGGTSSRWWIKYYVNGRAVREGTRTDDKDAAKRTLKQREGAAATGQPVMPRMDRIRYDEAVADPPAPLRDGAGDRVVPRWAREAMKPLNGFFTGRRLTAITPTVLTLYTQQRQTAGAANGTVALPNVHRHARGPASRGGSGTTADARPSAISSTPVSRSAWP